MKELHIALGGGYPLHIGAGLLKGPALADALRPYGLRVALITDDNVDRLYAAGVEASLKRDGFAVTRITMPAGDEHKTRATKMMIEDHLLEAGFGRDTVLLALGGGVVCDMAGFVASTYMRGVPVVYAPTTLLAMVDASVGGKTGVNTAFGKNMIGTVTHPRAVLMDVDCLKTQSDDEFVGGFIELVKHAMLQGDGVFAHLEANLAAILARDLDLLETLIADSCATKRKVVESDEKEAGLRQTLNLGHTLAHAIETASAYHIAHGPAVALGLLGEGVMAVELGYLSQDDFARMELFIRPLLDHMGHSLKGMDKQTLLDLMVLDKKSRGKVPHFVLLEGFGATVIVDGKYAIPVKDSVVERAIDYLLVEFA